MSFECGTSIVHSLFFMFSLLTMRFSGSVLVAALAGISAASSLDGLLGSKAHTQQANLWRAPRVGLVGPKTNEHAIPGLLPRQSCAYPLCHGGLFSNPLLTATTCNLHSLGCCPAGFQFCDPDTTHSEPFSLSNIQIYLNQLILLK